MKIKKSVFKKRNFVTGHQNAIVQKTQILADSVLRSLKTLLFLWWRQLYSFTCYDSIDLSYESIPAHLKEIPGNFRSVFRRCNCLSRR